MKSLLFIILINCLPVALTSQTLIKLGKFDISSQDLSKEGYSGPQRIDENDLIFYLEENIGWRLPTIDELLTMCKRRKELDMRGDFYLAKGVNDGFVLPKEYSNYSWYSKPQGQEFYVGFGQQCHVDIFASQDPYVRLVKLK